MQDRAHTRTVPRQRIAPCHRWSSIRILRSARTGVRGSEMHLPSWRKLAQEHVRPETPSRRVDVGSNLGHLACSYRTPTIQTEARLTIRCGHAYYAQALPSAWKFDPLRRLRSLICGLRELLLRRRLLRRDRASVGDRPTRLPVHRISGARANPQHCGIPLFYALLIVQTDLADGSSCAAHCVDSRLPIMHRVCWSAGEPW